jgi:hypothetical protein
VEKAGGKGRWKRQVEKAGGKGVCRTRFSSILTVLGGDLALQVRIAEESFRAGAHGLVVDGAADGVDAAGPDAGIPAFLQEAGFVASAVRVDDALRLYANGHPVPDSALAVARTRVAWIRLWRIANQAATFFYQIFFNKEYIFRG